MEKKTFNDLMANLPTTETDMTRVMVEMEDGRKGWISAEGLAQVMAGLIGTATNKKDGLYPKYYVTQYLEISTQAYKISNTFQSGHFCLAYLHSHWWHNASVGFIGVAANLNDKNRIIVNHYKLSDDDELNVYYTLSDNGFDLYITAKYEVRLRAFIGSIDFAITKVDLPEDAVPAEIIQ